MVNKCVACQKSVYPLEAIVDGDNWYHKGCFKVRRCALSRRGQARKFNRRRETKEILALRSRAQRCCGAPPACVGLAIDLILGSVCRATLFGLLFPTLMCARR